VNLSRLWIYLVLVVMFEAAAPAGAQNRLDADAMRAFGGTCVSNRGDNNVVFLYSAVRGVVYGKPLLRPAAR